MLASCIFISAQTTLWKDHNPYGSELRSGQLIEVLVNDSFDIDIDSQWNNATQIDIKLNPDKSYVTNLKNSEQNKVYKKKGKAEYQIRDKLNFSMMALVSAVKDQPGLFQVQARKTIDVDGKNATMTLSGLVSPKSVVRGKVHSTKIAQMVLRISSEPPFPRDKSAKLQPDDPKDQNASQSNQLSDADKKRFILQHLREVMSYFK